MVPVAATTEINCYFSPLHSGTTCRWRHKLLTKAYVI